MTTTKKKTKHKATKPPSKATLTDEDFELIATRTSDELKDTLDAIRDQQEKIQSAVEKQQQDLKALQEKTAAVRIPPANATARDASTSSIAREDGLGKERLNTVLIPPGSIRFPVTMKDPPAQFDQPIEVNLVEFHTEQLQMIEQQISAELRSRELMTYK